MRMMAGQDRAFRMFSVIQDAQSAELSQKHVAARAKRLKVGQAELKLPRVLALGACQVLPQRLSLSCTSPSARGDAVPKYSSACATGPCICRRVMCLL